MLEQVTRWLLEPSGLTPYGFSLLREPWLIWTRVLSDIGIGLAYFVISLAMARFAQRRRDLVFPPVFRLFAAFVLLCGTSQLLNLLTIWIPAYAAVAVVKAATAAVALMTVAASWRMMPKALALPSHVQMQAANNTLRESEVRHRASFEHSPVPQFTLSEDDMITGVSNSWLALLGYTRAEVAGRYIGDFWEPGSVPLAPSRRTEILATGELRDLERRFVRRDGTVIQVLVAGRIDRQGDSTVISCAMIDVTARRLAEAALRESEARHRTSFELSSVPKYTLDGKDNIIGVSNSWLVLLGYIRTEVIGRSIWDFRAIDTDRSAEAERSKLLEDGEVLDVDRRFLRRDGTVVEALVSARIDHWDGIAVSVCVLIDITARRHAEAVNRAAEARRRIGFEHSPIPLYTLDVNDFITEVSNSWLDLLGYTASEVVGKQIGDFQISRLENSVPIDRLRLMEGGEIHERNRRFLHRDGSVIEALVSGRLERTDETTVIVCVLIDVTARRHAEAALHASEERLRQSQKMEAVGQLTGGLAHDFNNMLQGITGSLELLRTRLAQGKLASADRYIAAAQGDASRAATLTQRLLAFSRRQVLDPEPTGADNLIAEIKDMIQRTVGPAIKLEVVPTANLWTTLCDANQMENALLNLCINARDAMPGGGRLTIETANVSLDRRGAFDWDVTPGEYVAICVTDTGTGMPLDVVARAFDPFFTTKPLGVGTGLGLSMIYGFAQQSGGQARIYSEVGVGTTVRIYLPRYLGEMAKTQAPDETGQTARTGKGETVLIVDDEPTVRMLVTEVLEEHGYTAIEAEDGAAGLKVLQSDARIDLLISDVGLPGGMNGRQMADAARIGRPDLKVLFITGYAPSAVVGNGRLEQGMHVVTKPFSLGELASKIDEIIGAG